MAEKRTVPRQLVALYAGTIATRFGTFVVPYLTLYLTQARGLSTSATGAIIGFGGLGLLAGNLAGGALADRVGRRPTLLLALVLNGLGVSALAFPLASSLTYVLALALASTGTGMYTPAAQAWIADLTPPARRARAFTVNYICINVGMGLGPLVGGLLAASSFRWLFVGDVLTTLLCALILAAATVSTPPARKGLHNTPCGDRGHVPLPPARWWSPSALRLFVFCGLSFFIIAPLMGLEVVVPLLVGTVLRQPLWLVGCVYSINAACILVLGLRIERALHRREPLLMMVLAGALWTAGLAILKLGLSAPALLACTVVWTLGEIVSSVVIPTYVSKHAPPSMRGRFLALPDAVRSLAGVLAPIGLGLVWDRSGADAVLSILVAMPAIGTLAFAATRFATRRQQERLA